MIDDQLVSRGSAPIGKLVELANLSSMIGNLVGGCLADSSGGLYVGNRPHAYPDLLALKEPAQPLELWSFEASPYCRIAREALCQLELPYILHNVGKNSPSRPAFVARSGKMMVPYLADPNTGKELFESAEIATYLHSTYGA